MTDVRPLSADTGMGEYMLKNFEAMAAGCVLLSQDQGAEENEAVGFRHMENVVLYQNAEEALEHLESLRSSPDLCARLAAAGRRHATERFSFSRLGGLIARRKNYDLVGFVVLAILTATAGGILRDICATHGALHLSELMRFTNPAEGAAPPAASWNTAPRQPEGRSGG